MTAQLPTLAGMVDGIVGRDLLGWTVQCRECGDTATDGWLFRLVGIQAIRFHRGGWPDGTNPRLCRACRLARGCHCTGCDEERRFKP